MKPHSTPCCSVRCPYRSSPTGRPSRWCSVCARRWRPTPQCAHTAASLAQLLHIAPRSLHRQLQQQGSSLQQLKDDVRRHRALHLLQRTDMPLKRVALACGFRNEKALSVPLVSGRARHQASGVSSSAGIAEQLQG